MRRHTVVGSGGRRGWLTSTAAAVAIAAAFGACSDTSTTPTAPSAPAFAAGTSLGVNLDQCANDPRTANCSWQNGDLNGNNSKYAEGLVVPFRLSIDGLTPGTHSFHLNYDFTAGGEEGYDFLADFDATEKVDVCAVGGGGRSALCDQVGGIGSGSQVTFPSDPFQVPGTLQTGSPPADLSVAGAEASALFAVSGKRHLTIWGGTITSITPAAGPVHSGPTTGNNSADFVVTFTTTGTKVAFAWGAHLAQSSYWKNADGSPDGAAEISGAPWHMRTQQLDNAGNKNQDRSIQPSAIIHPPSVTLTKTADAATVNAGDQIGFTITASNSGAGDATGFVLSDPLPTGTGITWSIASQSGSPACTITSGVLNCPSSGTGTLAAGATLTVHVTSPTTSQSCGTYTNTATVNFSTGTGGTVPPPATATVTVNCGDIKLTKTADASPVNAGETIGFTITAKNEGAGSATGVTVTDNLPTTSGLSWSIDAANSDTGCSISSGVLTCNFGTLAAGASKKVHLTSATTFASCATISNTANVTTTNDGSAQATAQVVVNCPDLDITKTADAATVDAGSSIGFTITVSNSGVGTAKSVSVSDALPTGTGISWSISPAVTGCSITSSTLSCNLGDLAQNGSVSIHVTSSTTSASCKTYSNTASAQATNHAQVTASASTTVQCPSLSITKTADAATVSAGSNIGFTITVSNSSTSGTGTATSVTLSDALPTGTSISWSISPAYSGPGSCSITSNTLSCSFGDLAAGGSASVHVQSATAVASCATYSNTASAQATNHAQVQASASTTVQCPSLSITKTPDKVGDTGYTVQPGDSAKFTITVSNTGSGSASNVVLTDTLPGGLTWVASNKTTCADPMATVTVNSETRQKLVCTIGTLAGSASFSVTVAALIPANFVQLPPTTGTTVLEIDGDLSPSSGGLDWGSSGLISCSANPPGGCDLDKPTGQTDDSFGQGTKEDTPVPSIVDGSIPNNKSDLTRFYLATNRVGTHDYLYVAWERVQAPSGTTNMDFELNQSSTVSSNGVTPVRTAGDVLIKYDLAQGGTHPTLGFHRWITSGSSAQCEASNSVPCWGKVTAILSGASAAINTGSVTDPINPNATRTLDALTFGEASIDLQASGIFQSGVCLNLSQAYLKSRSSDSFTAAIKDFIAPISKPITNCQDKLLDNRAWAAATGISAISDVGQIKVTVSSSASLFSEPANVRLARAGVVGSGTSSISSISSISSAINTVGTTAGAVVSAAMTVVADDDALGVVRRADGVRAGDVRLGGVRAGEGAVGGGRVAT